MITKNNIKFKSLSRDKKAMIIYSSHLYIFFFKNNNKNKKKTFFKNKKKYKRKGYPNWTVFFLSSIFISGGLFYRIFNPHIDTILKSVEFFIDPYLDFIDMLLEDEKIVMGYFIFFGFILYFIHLYNEWKKMKIK